MIVPGLLRVTPVVVGFVGLMLVGLGVRTSQLRRRYQVRFGDGGHADLGNASRAHGNLVEHGLVLTVLLLIWELQAAPQAALWAAAALIVIARLLHAIGFIRHDFRLHVAGAALTYFLEAALAVTVIVRALLA